MALTQISTNGVKDDAVTSGKIPANAVGSSEIAANAVTEAKIADNAVTMAKLAGSSVITANIVNGNITTPKIADEAVTLAKLEHGTSSNNGKFLRANNGADPTFETVNTDLSADSSPQLGGDLATNGNNIRFGDSSDGSSDDVLSFGASNDLLIYHYQDSSYIQDNGTGPLQIYTNGTDIRFKTSDGEVMAKMIKDGAVELYHNASKKFETRSDGVLIGDSQGYYCGDGADLRMFFNGTDGYIRAEAGKLHLDKAGGEKFIVCNPDAAVEIYHDNSKKFETASYGIAVTGAITSTGNIDVDDNVKLLLGTSDDLEIYHDGTHSYLKNTGGNLVLQGNGTNSIVLQSVVGENAIICNANAAVELYHDATKKLETTSYGSQVTGYQVQTNFPVASVTSSSAIDLTDAVLTSSNFYNQTHINQGSHFNASTGRFTCPVDGVYRIYFRASEEDSTSSNVRLRKNGVTINEAYDKSGNNSVSSEAVVGCSANDYLEVQVSRLKAVSGGQHKQITFQLIA